MTTRVMAGKVKPRWAKRSGGERSPQARCDRRRLSFVRRPHGRSVRPRLRGRRTDQRRQLRARRRGHRVEAPASRHRPRGGALDLLLPRRHDRPAAVDRPRPPGRAEGRFRQRPRARRLPRRHPRAAGAGDRHRQGGGVGVSLWSRSSFPTCRRPSARPATCEGRPLPEAIAAALVWWPRSASSPPSPATAADAVGGARAGSRWLRRGRPAGDADRLDDPRRPRGRQAAAPACHGSASPSPPASPVSARRSSASDQQQGLQGAPRAFCTQPTENAAWAVRGLRRAARTRARRCGRRRRLRSRLLVRAAITPISVRRCSR